MARKIIFDTDIGSDIDDAYALAFILCSPELQPVGITIAHGRTDLRARLALRMLYETGNECIPAAAGRRTTGGGSVNQAPWAEDFETIQPVGQSAAEFIVEQVNAAPGEITLLPVGPFTNIADALKLDPTIAAKIEGIVMMGGCVGWPEGATPEIRGEYNAVTDVEASQVMLSCGAPITMVPLDATMQVRLEADARAEIAAADTPLTDALTALVALWPSETPTLHDPLAVATAIDESYCGVESMRIAVDEAGLTRPVEGEPNARAAVRPDVARFLGAFMERLLGQDMRRK